MVEDWRTAPLGPPDRALCAFAEKLSAAPARMADADIEDLREQGFGDQAIHDATQVVAYFNYINRIADALDTNLEPGMPTRPRSWYPEPRPLPALSRDSGVSLEPVTRDNLSALVRMQVSPYQQRFVASNAVSLAQAPFFDDMTCLAIAADGAPVGFTMLENLPDKQAICIVRFLVDVRVQGMGFGSRAIALILDRARSSEGVRRVTLSYVPAPGSPESFYRRHGFVSTGAEDEDGELEMELLL